MRPPHEAPDPAAAMPTSSLPSPQPTSSLPSPHQPIHRHISFGAGALGANCSGTHDEGQCSISLHSLPSHRHSMEHHSMEHRNMEHRSSNGGSDTHPSHGHPPLGLCLPPMSPTNQIGQAQLPAFGGPLLPALGSPSPSRLPAPAAASKAVAAVAPGSKPGAPVAAAGTGVHWEGMGLPSPRHHKTVAGGPNPLTLLQAQQAHPPALHTHMLLPHMSMSLRGAGAAGAGGGGGGAGSGGSHSLMEPRVEPLLPQQALLNGLLVRAGGASISQPHSSHLHHPPRLHPVSGPAAMSSQHTTTSPVASKLPSLRGREGRVMAAALWAGAPGGGGGATTPKRRGAGGGSQGGGPAFNRSNTTPLQLVESGVCQVSFTFQGDPVGSPGSGPGSFSGPAPLASPGPRSGPNSGPTSGSGSQHMRQAEVGGRSELEKALLQHKWGSFTGRRAQ